MKRPLALVLGLIFQLAAFSGGVEAQSTPQGNGDLPDVTMLLQAASEKQDAFATQLQMYFCVMKDNDMNTHTSRLYESFYINGREIKHVLSVNDVPLNPSENKREEARVNQETQDNLSKPALSFAAWAGGWSFSTKEHRWSETVEAAILRVNTVIKESSIVYQGRPAIQIDFQGDPSLKAHTREERVARVFDGMIIVDAADRVIVRIQGEAKADVMDGTKMLVSSGSKIGYEARKIADNLYAPSAWTSYSYVYSKDSAGAPSSWLGSQEFSLLSCRQY